MSQTKDSISIKDLDEVVVDKRTFSSGHFTENISLKNSIAAKSSQSLGNLLNETTSIAFKEYGNGMLSSISYRGLAASHTAVFWEGLPVNSTLNGQIDFNLFSAQSFDNIGIRKGGGSAILGSGALGGSVLLSKTSSFNQKLKGNLSQTIGSFGLSNSGLGISWGNKEFFGNVALNYLYAENDFKRDNLLNGQEERQKNATVNLGSISSKFGYKWNDSNILTFSALNTFANRDLPGTAITSTSSQRQKDQSNRFSLKWENTQNSQKHSLQIGYLDEDYKYAQNRFNNQYTHSDAQTWTGRYVYTLILKNNFVLNAGMLGKTSSGSGSSYRSPSFNEASAFISANKNYKKFNFSLILNKGFSDQYNIPFTFDAGIDWVLNKNHLFKANYTTNYRTPTFNDLYWVPGGNRELKPEDSWMSELGYQFTNKIVKFQTSLYYGKVKNWILWIPSGSISTPKNIDKVESYGVESQVNIEKQLSEVKIKIRISHNYSISENEQTQTQLIYVPKNKVAAGIGAEFKKIQMYYQFDYTSQRFAQSNESAVLKSFSLSNIYLEYGFSILQKETHLQFGVKNIFNKKYYLIQYYSQPGINYSITLNINF